MSKKQIHESNLVKMGFKPSRKLKLVALTPRWIPSFFLVGFLFTVLVPLLISSN